MISSVLDKYTKGSLATTNIVSQSCWLKKKLIPGNVGKREHNDEWNTAIELLQPYSRQNRKNYCLLPVICCFTDWKQPYWLNSLQDENHEKTHQLSHRKHGHVRSAVSDFLFPANSYTSVFRLLANQWSSWLGLG